MFPLQMLKTCVSIMQLTSTMNIICIAINSICRFTVFVYIVYSLICSLICSISVYMCYALSVWEIKIIIIIIIIKIKRKKYCTLTTLSIGSHNVIKG